MPAGNVNRSDTEQSFANHEKRIRDLEWALGESLTVTDGGTTIDPTRQLDIGSGLSLAALGDGVAELAAAVGITAPLRFIHCQCLLGGAFWNAAVLGNGTPLPLDFFAGCGGNYITNDDPARPGHGTVAGDNSAPGSAFTGDCFTTDVADPATQAFAILPAPGMYLIRFSAVLVPWPDPGDFRGAMYPSTTASLPGLSFTGVASTLNHGNVSSLTESTVFIIHEHGFSAPPPKTPVGLTLQQFSGTDTDPTVGPTQAEIFCVRLSPLPDL